MTKEEQEQLIRAKILPQLNSIADSVWEGGDCWNGDRLLSIVNELTNILEELK